MCCLRRLLRTGVQAAAVEAWSRRKLAAHVAGLAVSLGVLAAGAVAASRFTSAYWVQVLLHCPIQLPTSVRPALGSKSR